MEDDLYDEGILTEEDFDSSNSEIESIVIQPINTNTSEHEFYSNYDITKYKSEPYLTKYERTLILSERVQHLSNGCNAYIDTTNISNLYDIAVKELTEGKIPYIIKRIVGNNIELWKLTDFKNINFQ